MKYITAAMLAAALFLTPVPAAAADGPEVSAKAAVVMEADSGRVLWEKQPDERMLIASTTKIMTALIAMERCGLDDQVTVDPAWTGIEGSSMYLAPGQQLTVRDLLYGLMLASGNDAAVALACVTAGSVEAFASLMNERAAALGCENTHFMNPNGLDDPEHYASARDLALITREAISNAAFCDIASARSATVGENTYRNHNRLLSECPGVYGVKTGYTMAAGRSLVSCCERDGLRLICVTLSDPDDWDDHKALYDWAYGQYTNTSVLPDSAAWPVPVIGGETETVLVAPAGELPVLRRTDEEVTMRYCLPPFVYAGVEAGCAAGEAVAYVNGEEAGRVPLVYTQSVAQTWPSEPAFLERVRDFLEWAEGNIYTLR